MNFIPVNIIPRNHYIDRIKPFIGKPVIKVFTGQRRVGKSYLLFQLMNYIQTLDTEANIIFINKEDLNFSFLKTANDLVEYVDQHKPAHTMSYLFIDEIQDIEAFGAALRSLALDTHLDIYCTGSNASMLSSDIAGHLSGRYIEVYVQSLSYTEFLQFHALQSSNHTLELYIKYGGLPFLKHLALEDEIVFEYLKNIYSTIIYRDIINRYAIRNAPFLEKLVHFLCSSTGSIFSAKKISDYLKSQKVNIPPNQVQVYVGHLVNAYLVYSVSRFDIIGKRIFEIGEKYYFENSGIRHALWGYRLEDRGKIMENVVFNHLVFCGYTVHVGVLNDYEIDFAAQKKGEKWYIQVALMLNDEQTIQRELGNLDKINDHYRKTLITLDAYQGNSYKGIEITDLKSFLEHIS